ncbi:MAG: PDZ domain-containing protein [Desulfobacterales bacterium]
MIVVNVAPDSKGAKAGIAKGDVIKEINHQPLKDVDDYKAIVKKVDDGESLYFYIKRMNKGFIVVKSSNNNKKTQGLFFKAPQLNGGRT